MPSKALFQKIDACVLETFFLHTTIAKVWVFFSLDGWKFPGFRAICLSIQGAGKGEPFVTVRNRFAVSESDGVSLFRVLQPARLSR